MGNESHFWLYEATEVDIAGAPPVDLQACFDAIIPELPANPSRMLEIGCGVGRLSIPIAQEFPDTLIWGIDISARFLKAAAERAERVDPPVPRLFFVQTDSVPKQMKFDAIYTMLTFQHLPHKATRKYLLESANALQQGGILRFQHVRGSIDHDNNHQISEPEELLDWVEAAGLKVKAVDEGLIHEQWIWVTATK